MVGAAVRATPPSLAAVSQRNLLALEQIWSFHRPSVWRGWSRRPTHPYDQAVLARPPVVGFTVLPVSVLAGRRGPSCQKGLSSRLDPRPGSFGVNVVCTQVGFLLCSQHGKDKVLVTLGLDAGEVAAWAGAGLGAYLGTAPHRPPWPWTRSGQRGG